MRFSLLLGVCLMAGLAYGQLIIDEDDPAGKKLIDKMMLTINEHEKATYTFKTVVYSLPVGNEERISVLLKVADAHGAILQCTVEIIGTGHPTDISTFTVSSTGAVVCKK